MGQFTSAEASIDARPRAAHVMLGTTQSLCPECMEVVDAKIVSRRGRVYFRKRCPTHGTREDFVCSDVGWWDRPEGHTAAVLPQFRQTEATRGCPYDCGLCEEHEQHSCIGLVELTDACNLACPICFASSGPGGTHRTLEEIIRALDLLVASEGRAEVCQLSGGEPTLHPQFETVLDAALQRPIDYVMINTNGIRLAKDPALVQYIADRRDRVEIYLQWDGADAATTQRLRGADLRGEDLLDVKRRALDRLGDAGIHVTLVATLHSPLPNGFYESIWQEVRRRRNITGISLQPATYTGRHCLPADLEQRVTFPDAIRGLAVASGGAVEESDFTPLPCAHPNCHQILLAARSGETIVPLSRVAPLLENLDLLAGGISFTRDKARHLMRLFLERAAGCAPGCGCGDVYTLGAESNAAAIGSEDAVLRQFLDQVLAGQARATDLLRVTITSFLDPYNFDIRQLMKCCTHHVLPSGHIIPFCAYNTLYRTGHLPLPKVRENS